MLVFFCKKERILHVHQHPIDPFLVVAPLPWCWVSHLEKPQRYDKGHRVCDQLLYKAKKPIEMCPGLLKSICVLVCIYVGSVLLPVTVS